MSFVINI